MTLYHFLKVAHNYSNGDCSDDPPNVLDSVNPNSPVPIDVPPPVLITPPDEDFQPDQIRDQECG